MNTSTDIASIRLPLAMGVLLLLLAWEVVQPYFANFTRGPGALQRRGLNAALNLGLGAVNALIISGVFVGLWAATMAWAETRGFGLLRWLSISGIWHGLLAILLLDAWTYAWHRLNHVLPVLWRFHRLHHSDTEMNVTTANRFHLVEIVLSSTLRLPLLALFGVRLEELALYDTLLFAVVQFHHANIGVPEWLDRALRCLIVTPHLHKVHHSVVRADADSNFSSLFSWWDRLFRTFRLSREPRRIVFGVDDSR
jgi:sterol desaturase/sphingolipid hydroxylase (fatty acid hydroxylase superfamily)